MTETMPGDDEDPAASMPHRLRDLLAELTRAEARSGDGMVVLELTRRLRDAARRELPAASPLRRSITSEDLLQETVAELMRNAIRFRGRTWASFFAFAKVVMRQRKTAHVRRARVRQAERDGSSDAGELHDPRARTPSVALAVHDDATKAAALVRALASPYRETLELKLSGLSTEQIARRMDVGESTVRKRINRALRMLQTRW